jgi:hypothetical protein
MNKHIAHIVSGAAITGWFAIAGNMAQAQTPEDLDQSAFPIITAQPTDQCVEAGSNATFTVQAIDGDSYQWLSNGIAIEGQTNSTLIVENAGADSAGAYSCNVSQNGGDAVPTRAASLNVIVADLPGGGPITVFGLPKLGGGTQGTCPGSYAGYVNYTKTPSQGWGWTPATNTTTIFTASDGGGRTDTAIVYLGKRTDNGCGQTSVTIPNPPVSTAYRFTIYFQSNVPTTNYPIILTGFNP